MSITKTSDENEFAEPTVSSGRSSASRTLFGDLVQFIEFIGIIATSVLVAYVYIEFWRGIAFDYQYYTAAGIIGATGVTALLRRDGFYDFDRFIAPAGIVRIIVSRWILVVLGLIAFGFALKVSQNFSRVWLVSWSVTVLVFLLLTRWGASLTARAAIKDGGALVRRIAIVGANDTAQRFVELLDKTYNGFSVVGIYDVGGAARPGGETPKGNLRMLEQAARDGAVDDIVIAALDASRDEMKQIVTRLSALPVSVSICSNMHWLDHQGGEVTRLGGMSTLSLYRRPLEGWGSVIKLIEDYVLGSLMLLIASPIMLLIALAIKLQDGGPILFAQKRHGFNNSVFRIYKFRTMTVAEDGDKVIQATQNDIRVTPIGRLLRRYSLDELPQLINVVLGQMSLIGPRPHALAHNHQYAQMIENYSGRHKVKPGISGWAQVNGYRGETSENEMMEERVRYDLAYIDNWSPIFDLKILVMTLVAVVFPKNAV